jgi:hypothetical protein
VLAIMQCAREQAARFHYWSTRMAGCIVPRALRTRKAIQRPLSILLTVTARCSLCTGRQRARQCPVHGRLSNG